LLVALLIADPDLRVVVPGAMKIAVDLNDVDAAFRLPQYLAEDPLTATRAALEQYPLLRSHFYSDELVQQIAEFGHVDMF